MDIKTQIIFNNCNVNVHLDGGRYSVGKESFPDDQADQAENNSKLLLKNEII